jgi:hypothetical protein
VTRHAAALGTVLLLCFAAPTSRAVDCTGQALCGSNVTASAGSGGSTIASQTFDALASVANQNLGPAETERLADTSSPGAEGNISHEIAQAHIAVDAGVFAISMGTTSDAHDYGLNVYAGGSSRITYDEDLSVQSQTVLNGTPVLVRLRYRIDYGFNLAHSAAALDYSSQYTDVTVEVTGSLDNHFGGSGIDQSFWWVFKDLSSNITGLFTTANPVVTLEVPVDVGQHVRLHFYVNGGAGSQASVTGVDFPTAASAGTVAVVFGVETDTPGVQVVSSLLGGSLPDFSNVTPANAAANLLPVSIGGPVTVPEPAAALLDLAALLALVAARYAGSHANA